jgi:hypothetical protein
MADEGTTSSSSNNLTDLPVTPKKEIRRPLKPKDIAFIKKKAENPLEPDYKIAMAVTGTKSTNVASTQVARMLQNVTLKEALNEALAKQGYSIDDAAQTLVEASQATKSFVSEGELKESDIPDHAIRLNATRAMLTLLDERAAPGSGGGNTINFNFGAQKNYVKGDN